MRNTNPFDIWDEPRPKQLTELEKLARGSKLYKRSTTAGPYPTYYFQAAPAQPASPRAADALERYQFKQFAIVSATTMMDLDHGKTSGFTRGGPAETRDHKDMVETGRTISPAEERAREKAYNEEIKKWEKHLSLIHI